MKTGKSCLGGEEESMEEKNFANFLYELRKKNHITQRQLGHFIGVGHRVISKWETGICLPDAEKLLALSRFFGMSVDNLLAGKMHEADAGAFTKDGVISILPDSLTKKSVPSETGGGRNLIPPASDRFYGDYFCSWRAQQITAKALGLVGWSKVNLNHKKTRYLRAPRFFC